LEAKKNQKDGTLNVVKTKTMEDLEKKKERKSDWERAKNESQKHKQHRTETPQQSMLTRERNNGKTQPM